MDKRLLNWQTSLIFQLLHDRHRRTRWNYQLTPHSTEKSGPQLPGSNRRKPNPIIHSPLNCHRQQWNGAMAPCIWKRIKQSIGWRGYEQKVTRIIRGSPNRFLMRRILRQPNYPSPQLRRSIIIMQHAMREYYSLNEITRLHDMQVFNNICSLNQPDQHFVTMCVLFRVSMAGQFAANQT